MQKTPNRKLDYICQTQKGPDLRFMDLNHQNNITIGIDLDPKQADKFDFLMCTSCHWPKRYLACRFEEGTPN
jgi:hypothetical protein